MVETPQGIAVVHLALPTKAARALALLGHGAGGSSQAAALLGVCERLLGAGIAVGLVDQPYRVAGRRFPDPAARLDEAMAAVAIWSAGQVGGVPLLLGGKSSGARVGARVARGAGAVGVVALGFPLRSRAHPDRSRASELDAGCPVLVVQGSRDGFGTPDEVRAAAGDLPVTVHEIAGGDHSFVPRRADGRTTAECLREAADVVVRWVRAGSPAAPEANASSSPGSRRGRRSPPSRGAGPDGR